MERERSTKQSSRRPKRKASAKEPTEQQIAGQILSNIAYNMAQRKVGEPLTDSDLRVLKRGYERWDASRPPKGTR